MLKLAGASHEEVRIDQAPTWSTNRVDILITNGLWAKISDLGPARYKCFGHDGETARVLPRKSRGCSSLAARQLGNFIVVTP